MKNSKLIIIAATLIIWWQHVSLAQGFVNLDFESVIPPLVPSPGGFVPASNALPGWTAYLGGNPQTGVYYNSFALDAAAVILEDPASGFSIIQGSYSVYLQSATIGVPSGSSLSAGIGQTGMIPSDAMSVFFVAGFGVPQVTFAGQEIQVTALGASSGYTLYGGDVSMFANQTGELLFSVTRQGSTRQQVLLDNIYFSPSAVPEPSALSLLALGLLGLGWRQWGKVRT
ncbi:MAG TPA: PEP-CTERM sorting domain-containing protein [Verrucomicrobiae bacterium]|nr:PEP-CTERM sorting domain-containing protein [Verrucomicrobiae bacterium]